MSDLPTPADVLVNQQRAYLLHQLATAPDGRLTQKEANAGIPKLVASELKLPAKAANQLRKALAPLIHEEQSGKTVAYSITTDGRDELRKLELYIPLLPAGGKYLPAGDATISASRECYVLDALGKATSQTIPRRGLDAAFGGKPKLKVKELTARHPQVAMFRDQACLGLNPVTVRRLLTDLALGGMVRVSRTVEDESYSLTPVGAERLIALRPQCPLLPPTGRPTKQSKPAMKATWEAFVLAGLFNATVRQEADVKQPSCKKGLKPNAARLWTVRGELANAGHLTAEWDGHAGVYTLTPAGVKHLAGLSFDGFDKIEVKGPALTALLAAARGGAKEPAHTPVPPTAAELEAAVIEIFHRLLRERHANIRMVPIHEVRAEVRERFGERAASREVFNELLLDLRRAKKVRLTSSNDLTRASEQQVADSVFAVGETFFYLEAADAPVSSG